MSERTSLSMLQSHRASILRSLVVVGVSVGVGVAAVVVVDDVVESELAGCDSDSLELCVLK